MMVLQLAPFLCLFCAICRLLYLLFSFHVMPLIIRLCLFHFLFLFHYLDCINCVYLVLCEYLHIPPMLPIIFYHFFDLIVHEGLKQQDILLKIHLCIFLCQIHLCILLKLALLQRNSCSSFHSSKVIPFPFGSYQIEPFPFGFWCFCRTLLLLLCPFLLFLFLDFDQLSLAFLLLFFVSFLLLFPCFLFYKT